MTVPNISFVPILAGALRPLLPIAIVALSACTSSSSFLFGPEDQWKGRVRYRGTQTAKEFGPTSLASLKRFVADPERVERDFAEHDPAKSLYAVIVFTDTQVWARVLRKLPEVVK